ncbi:hypothetical protein ABIB86_000455 [Bradyrhizobium sp. JR1.7]|uniref:hypothetical protein n=1 Tax=unclassified Bradyrhizobium TaxID=2631580 RepID=UPI003396DA65
MTGGHLNYGPCEGGPYHKKRLADHREVRHIAVDTLSGKPFPALVSSKDPHIRFGSYHWSGNVWIWRTPDSE